MLLLQILAYFGLAMLCIFLIAVIWVAFFGDTCLRKGLIGDNRPMDDAENDPDYCNKLHEDM